MKNSNIYTKCTYKTIAWEEKKMKEVKLQSYVQILTKYQVERGT